MNRVSVILLIGLLLACKNSIHTNSPTSNSNRKDSLLRVLTYGLAEYQSGVGNAVIAKQYGYYYYPVAGCVVTKELVDSINDENAKVYHEMAVRHGKDWKLEYSRKSDLLFKLLNSVETVVNKEPIMQKLNRQHNNGLCYHIAPTDTANVFTVQTFDINDGNFTATFIIHLQTRKINRVQ